MTAAADAQRSSWLRSDPKISVEAVRKPGLKLEWKLKPVNTARELNSLMPSVLLDFYIGYRGFRALSFVAASADRMIAFDTELGRLEWQKDLTQPNAKAQKTANCPGGVTSSAARPTTTAYPALAGSHGSGRGTPAKSGVGLPDEGAVTLKRATPPPPPKPVAPAPKPVVPAAANPYEPKIQYVMALSGDGYLHSLWVSNGNEANPPVRFIAPGADAKGLIVFGDTAYVATQNHCGGGEDGVWALDLHTSDVKHWKPQTGTIAGTVGPAVGPSGRLYAATTAGQVAALEPKTLIQLAIQTVPGVQFTSSPVVFESKGKDVVAVSASDGGIYLFDGAGLDKLGMVSATKTSYQSGALTSWVDSHQTRWILQTTATNVIAWKVTENNSAFTLEQGWKSGDMLSPLPPLVNNGVVFALSSGQPTSDDPKMKLSKRIKASVPAVLYALDGATGKELWNSGTQITSFVHSGALSAGETRVYLADYDGNEYAFGIPIEH